jgi:hypothetical protein
MGDTLQRPPPDDRGMLCRVGQPHSHFAADACIEQQSGHRSYAGTGISICLSRFQMCE